MDITVFQSCGIEYCESRCDLKNEEMLNKNGELCSICPMKGYIRYLNDRVLKVTEIFEEDTSKRTIMPSDKIFYDNYKKGRT